MKLRNLDKVAQENENDLSRYFRRTNDGKLLLRQAMSRYIPPEIANAEKQGFSAPDASWFKGESIEYVRREILDRRARIFDYLDRGTVDNLVSEHLDGRQNRRLLIWSLLSFEWWLRKYLD